MCEFKGQKLCWVAGEEIYLTKYFPFEIILFSSQETSWWVKQYSSTLLPNYRIHLCPVGKGNPKVITAQNLIQEMSIKHHSDVLFILMVYFSPTHLKHFTIQLILVVCKHISSLREGNRPGLLQSSLAKVASWPAARCFSLVRFLSFSLD